MCKFTYLGYDRCDEPERHYLIRREKCSAKAHIKHWCAPHEQEEDPSANQQGKFWVSLPCPMCAETPVIYDQPLLEIAHSRRSVLPAPHYDAVTRKYTRLPKHQAPPGDLPESVVPRPLKTTRMQVRRAATESAVSKTNSSNKAGSENYTLPATTYIPPPQELKLPKPLPIPQPVTLTPPSSREGSRSPPQIRMDGALRTTPPGQGNRRELESIREKARAATASAQESRAATPDRSRSGSASSSTSDESARPSQPSRKASNASITTASSLSSKATSTTTSSRHRWQVTPSRHAHQDSVADTIANAALRSIGIDRNPSSRSGSPSRSPERGRKPRRRPTGGSSSERSDNSPCVWRPTISPPVLQNDSLGIGSSLHDAVEPFEQRLVPFPPVRMGATPNGASVAKGQGLVEDDPPRPRTPRPHGGNSTKTPALSLFPNAANDEEVAAAAFEKMFAAEAKAHAYQVRAQTQAHTQAQAQVELQMQARAGSEAGSRRDKVLPTVPAPLRRITSGQVRTVNVPPPRPLRRQNTSDAVVSAASSSKSSPQPGAGAVVKVKSGPLFSFAGVGGKAQEFEIVTGPDGSILQDPAYGQAF